MVDKSKREDGTFSREDFRFDQEQNIYICPAGKVLTTTGRLFNDGETLYYRAKARDCRSCILKAQCCSKLPMRRIQRSIYEEARQYRHGERTKAAIGDQRKFSALLKMLRAGLT